MIAMDESETSGAAKRQVFVRCNGRALRTTVAALTSFFESCGKPTAILNKWGEEPVGGAIYEVALVTFKKNKACEKAIALSGGDLDGRPLVIGLNTKPPARRGVACGSCRVFVGNLAFEADDAAVRAHFASCGSVQFVRFATKTGADGERQAGYAFVIFSDPDGRAAAVDAALALDGTTLCDRAISVAPAVQQPKRNATKGQGRRKSSGQPGGDGGGETKRLRPAAWRHDPKTGLTAPRPKKGAWQRDR